MKQSVRQTSYFLIGQKDPVSISILVNLRDDDSSHAMISEEHSWSLRSGKKENETRKNDTIISQKLSSSQQHLQRQFTYQMSLSRFMKTWYFLCFCSFRCRWTTQVSIIWVMIFMSFFVWWVPQTIFLECFWLVVGRCMLHLIGWWRMFICSWWWWYL